MRLRLKFTGIFLNLRNDQDACPVSASVATGLGARYMTTKLSETCSEVSPRGEEKVLQGSVEYEHVTKIYSADICSRRET